MLLQKGEVRRPLLALSLCNVFDICALKIMNPMVAAMCRKYVMKLVRSDWGHVLPTETRKVVLR